MHSSGERTFTVKTVDEVDLAVTVFGRNEHLSVVYVHGILADGRFWRPLVAHLLPQLGSAVSHTIYDARGHGLSAWPAKRSSTDFSVLADDLAAVVAAIGRPVLLVAHSLGTCVVQEYARRHTAQLRAAVMGMVWYGALTASPSYPLFERRIAPATRWLRPLRGGSLDWLNARGHSALERKFRKLTASSVSPERAQLVPSSTPCDPRVLGDLVASLLDYQMHPDATKVLAEIPVDLVAARFDRLSPPERLVSIADQIPQARMTTVPTGGHALPSSHPVLAAPAVDAAVSGLIVRGGSFPARSGEMTTPC